MKTLARQARHRRVRARVQGTAERPRLVVFRGTKTVSAQLVDDVAGTVLATTEQHAKGKGATIALGTAAGTAIAAAAKQQKVATVVFDRAGYQYHGIVKAVAIAAREGGLTL